MNRRYVTGLVACLMIYCTDGQVGNPGQIANDATANQANNDMNNAADKGVNKAEQGIGNVFKKKNKQPNTDTTQPKQNAVNTDPRCNRIHHSTVGIHGR